MIPIHQLLNRIRWDHDYAQAVFDIGYYDRIAHKIQRIPLAQTIFDKDNAYFFHFIDDEGIQHQVPLHRIKQVFRNGELIWHREH